MRSFQQIVAVLFAFLMCAVASSAPASEAYDATVYVTSTVYRVNTVTLSGSSTASLANQTSTISAVYSTGAYAAGNGTSATATSSNPSQFTGAASALHANTYLAVLAAGVGYLVL